mmetsp:Transcript_21312/g.34265  ORF Transcript_21312/g.34265 Transcript_21312/m.34265 type:complete len:250 (-) Transcript_21312:246-995(-)
MFLFLQNQHRRTSQLMPFQILNCALCVVRFLHHNIVELSSGGSRRRNVVLRINTSQITESTEDTAEITALLRCQQLLHQSLRHAITTTTATSSIVGILLLFQRRATFIALRMQRIQFVLQLLLRGLQGRTRRFLLRTRLRQGLQCLRMRRVCCLFAYNVLVNIRDPLQQFLFALFTLATFLLNRLDIIRDRIHLLLDTNLAIFQRHQLRLFLLHRLFDWLRLLRQLCHHLLLFLALRLQLRLQRLCLVF